MSQKVLKVGLIGGHKAFIAGPHQRAVFSSGTRKIVAGALHQDPETAMQAAADWPYPIQGFPDYQQMLEERPDLDFVVVATPNHCHAGQVEACLKVGKPVWCEKPFTMTVAEAQKLHQMAMRRRIPGGICHTYVGHWTSQFMRWVMKTGKLGKQRKGRAKYSQGWLADRAEDQGSQQAIWRVNPRLAGPSGCGGDIGTHAFMQMVYVADSLVDRILFANLTRFVPNRELDDDFFTYCVLKNGAVVEIAASQVEIGHKNDLGLEINCVEGGMVWRQEEPEAVTIFRKGKADLIYWRGQVPAHDDFLGDVPPELLDDLDWPGGHTEGLDNALRRLYRGFECDVRRFQAGRAPIHAGTKYIGFAGGVAHMKFIAAAVKCARAKKPVKIAA